MISPDEEKLLKIGAAALVKPITDAMGNILGPASKRVGIILEQMLCDQLRNVDRVWLRAASMLADAGLPVRPVPLKILKGILDGASVEEDKEMQEMWSSLLANAGTEGGGWEVPPTYIQILRGLSPGDAAVFNHLFGRMSGALGDNNVGTLEEIERGLPEYNVDRLYQHLKHLEHHDLISSDFETSQGIDTLTKNRHYYITPLGGLFYHACRPPNKGPSATP